MEEETEPKILTMKTTERIYRKLQVTLKGDKGAITYFLNKKFPPENKHCLWTLRIQTSGVWQGQ